MISASCATTLDQMWQAVRDVSGNWKPQPGFSFAKPKPSSLRMGFVIRSSTQSKLSEPYALEWSSRVDRHIPCNSEVVRGCRTQPPTRRSRATLRQTQDEGGQAATGPRRCGESVHEVRLYRIHVLPWRAKSLHLDGAACNHRSRYAAKALRIK